MTKILIAAMMFALAVPVTASTAWARRGGGGGGGGGGGCVNKPSRDCDGDGLDNATEDTLGTDKLAADTDGDGLDDGAEHLVHGTDPTAADTDADGLGDGDEIAQGTDPFDDDTDDDWLLDGEEWGTYGSDPLLADTDGDGFLDNYEAYYGTDPLDPDTDDDGVLDDVDCFPFDPSEWSDRDDDGIGDNSDGTNIIDDVRESPGGASIAAGTPFPATLDLLYCPGDLVGPVDGSNPNCEPYPGISMDANLIAGQVEWDEWLDANGVWNFRWAAPTIEASSIRMVGPRIHALPGYSLCYEGEILSAGGGFHYGWGVEWLYYFQTGLFRICIL